MHDYDLIADWSATDRGRSIGVAEALAVAATLPARSRILDIGCGNGVPIIEALVKRRPSGCWPGQFVRNACPVPRVNLIRWPFERTGHQSAVLIAICLTKTTLTTYSAPRSKISIPLKSN
jgi:hypothetical protein